MCCCLFRCECYLFVGGCWLLCVVCRLLRDVGVCGIRCGSLFVACCLCIVVRCLLIVGGSFMLRVFFGVVC